VLEKGEEAKQQCQKAVGSPQKLAAGLLPEASPEGRTSGE